MSNSRNWANPRQIVRPRSSGRVPVLLCLLLAGLCSLAVYRWGYEHWWPTRAKPTYTATAYVVEPAEGLADVRPSRSGTPYLTSTANDSNVRYGVPDLHDAPARVPLTNTDADPQRAREAADAMADLYVSDRDKEWRGSTDQSLSEARRWVEEARQEHQQSITRLEAFKQKRHETAVEEKTAEFPRQQTITNPQWLKLEQESMQLIKQRDELLATRTDQHPAVIEVSDQIVEIERQMAAIPRDIPFSDEAAEQDASMSVAVENADRAKSQKMDALTAAVSEAEESLREAELAALDTEERLDSPPRYAVEYAGVVENPPAFDYGWRRLMWTTLAAGLMMAFGAGTFSFGAGVEPPVGSASEVKKTTGKSVVGTIPSEDTATDQAEIHRQTSLQRTAITIGLLLILACPAVAVWGVLGI